MESNDHTWVWLRRSADGASFVSATEALDIPKRCAQRCELIEHLASVKDGSDDDLPLPLSMLDVKAWLVCAQEVARVDNRHNTPLKQDDATLSTALKVRNYLSVVSTEECNIVMVHVRCGSTQSIWMTNACLRSCYAQR